MNECRRHAFPSVFESRVRPHYVRRCAHLGNRFVVEIVNGYEGSAFVDYVQERPFLVETHYRSDGDTDELWDRLNERMLAGKAPWPELDD